MTEPRMLMGSRIYLRDVRESDATPAYVNWMNDPEVNQYLESRFAPATIESLKSFIRSHASGDANVFLAIVLRDGGRHVGNIKLGPINWIHRVGDIGLVVGEKDCWGKGVATEAISLMVAYAFSELNLRKVTAGAYSINYGSIRAFQKVGFEIEGVRRAHFTTPNGQCDHVLLGLLKEDWTKRNSNGAVALAR